MRRIVLFFCASLACILMGFHYASVHTAPAEALPGRSLQPRASALEALGGALRPPEFEVPEGFAIEEAYSPEEAGTIVAITFDSQGRLVASREDSSIVTLLDTDEDGTFDAERLFTDQVTNSQGLLFDGPDLLAVGDGPEPGEDDSGLYRVVDEEGDGQGDRVETVTRAIDGMQEHGPHNVFFGPDGYLYWTLGNHTNIRPHPAPLSPLNEYDEAVLAMDHTDPRGHAEEIRAPGGKFVRRDLNDPDAPWELVVGGFRNQYDGDFNMMGELFTFDSDMEWDRDLPWFRPTRSVHAVPGGDYGWRTGSRKLPPYYIDTVPPMKDQGRGSPTGVTFYQSYNYPESYHGRLLQGDWSRGRILMSSMERDGATYTQNSAGDFVYGQPLNVTDVEVGPDGNVYFSLGGRGTQGGLYRVVYNGPDPMGRPEANTPVARALTMPQPRSAWSRRQVREIKAEMGEQAWQQELVAVVQDAQAAPERRVRALELLQVYGPRPDAALLTALGDDATWQVRAASTYHLGLHATEAVRRELARRLQDPNPFVQRRAAEALVRTGVHPSMEVPFSAVEDVFPLLESEDRFVRYAARILLQRMGRGSWSEEALQAEGYPQAPEALMAFIETIDNPSVFDVRRLLRRELALLQADPTSSELVPLIRVIQRTMLEDHGVRTFYDDDDGAKEPPMQDDEPETTIYEQMATLLLERFPAADSSANREIARTLAYLEPPEAVGALVAELDEAHLSREQQIHYAYALSSIDAGWDSTAANQMTAWYEKVHKEGWRGGASFSGYLRTMREDFQSSLPDALRPEVAKRLAALEEAQTQTAANFASLSGPDSSAHDISDQELAEELIYDPQSFAGDPGDGAVAYQKALCAACHTFGPLGQEFGPDLTTVGQRFSRADLVEAIIYPSRTVSDLWAVEQITTTEGDTVMGAVYNEEGQQVVLQVPPGRQVTVEKSNIASRSTASNQSLMPERLHHYLSQDELVDLLLLLEQGVEAIPDSMKSS